MKKKQHQKFRLPPMDLGDRVALALQDAHIGPVAVAYQHRFFRFTINESGQLVRLDPSIKRHAAIQDDLNVKQAERFYGRLLKRVARMLRRSRRQCPDESQ